jgi:hypothetical protein
VNQAEFSRKFDETHREQFNPDLFRRDNQELVDSIEQVVRSIERDKYFTLKLLSFETIWNYEEIYDTLKQAEEGRKKKGKYPNEYDFIDIRDSDIILCKLKWYICHNGLERIEQRDGKTIEVINPEQELEVLIALPRFVRGYYFRLNGNYYTTAFQIVDGSTYNNNNTSNSKADTNTMKTMFMPIRIFRTFVELVDIKSNTKLSVIEYCSNIFSNTVNAMFYLLAQFGLYGTSDFLGIHCIAISDKPNLDPNYVCFEKNDIYVSCPSELFKDAMVQSYIATLIRAIYKETTLNDLFDQRYWLKILGIAYKNASIDKGLFVLDSIDGIYDKITKNDLHLPEEDKADIYTITRWLLREFSALKMKENVDVRTKRIRLSDYIAALYATKLNQGMYRVSDMGKRVTLKRVIQAVNINPMFLLGSITSASMSNLVSYRDLVNDNDAMSALKYTYKGISGLGEGGGSIQKIYRYVDPSHLGILDLDASSNSDPGMSGIICPLSPLYDDHSFSIYDEPNTWRENYQEMHNNKSLYMPNAVNPITFNQDPGKLPYEKFRSRIEDEELEITKVTCPIKTISGAPVNYTCAGALPIAKKDPKEKKSLFSIIYDDEDDSDDAMNNIYLNEDEDPDD